MDREIFIHHLKKARESRGLTQKAVAEALGISDRTYSKWETGETEPGIELLCRLGDYYGISPAEFLREEAPSNGAAGAELLGLTPVQAFLRAGEITDEVYDALCGNAIRWHERWDDTVAALYAEPLPVQPVPEGQNGFFCHGKTDEAFFLREWSEDINLRLLLLPSQTGFAWMKAQAADMARLFRALSNISLLELLIQSPPDRWYTPEYLSRETGLSPAEAREVLELLRSCHLTLRIPTRTPEGELDTYPCPDTRLLRAMVSLAHLLLGEARKEEDA